MEKRKIMDIGKKGGRQKNKLSCLQVPLHHTTFNSENVKQFKEKTKGLIQ